MAKGVGALSPPAIVAVLHGAVEGAIEGEAPDTARGGAMIGMYETLAGCRLSGRAVAIEDGSALRLDRAELFNLLADRVELTQALFSALLHARAAPPRRTATPAPEA